MAGCHLNVGTTFIGLSVALQTPELKSYTALLSASSHGKRLPTAMETGGSPQDASHLFSRLPQEDDTVLSDISTSFPDD